MINGAWQWHDYTYTAAGNPTPVAAAMTGPTPGSTLSSSSATFNWTTGNAVTRYWVWIGDTGPGSLNLYDVDQAQNTSVTVNGLPTDRRTLYVRLFSWLWDQSAWIYNDYTYTAAAPPLTISTASLPSTTQAMNYSTNLAASGGTPPYFWSITQGALPQGVQMSTGGLIMGWPVNVGSTDFTVTVRDNNSNTVSRALTLTVLQNVVQVQDSLGHQSSYTAAVQGASFYVTDSSGSGCASCTLRGPTHSVLDPSGNVTSVTDALSHTVTYTYDADNNVLTQTVRPDANTTATTTYTYNAFGEPLTVEDALHHVTTNTYDSHGNLKSVTTPQPDANTPASLTSFDYDSKGQLTTITDPLGHHTDVTYTAAGLIETITDHQGHVTAYEYDARGNRTAIVDANQKRTEFDYDLMNRLTTIRYPDDNGKSVSFGYDTRGRRTSVTDQYGGVTQYGYDDADRLVSVTDAADNPPTTYVYDTESNLKSITDANANTTSFDYDAYGRVVLSTFPSRLQESYLYDAVGNLTNKTDRKGQAFEFLYDGVNRLTHKGYQDSTGVDYVYDLVGKLQQVSDPSGTYTFTYDDMGRLTGTTTQYSFLTGRQFSNSYHYDAASNRDSFTAPDNSTIAYVYDTLNRLQTLTSSVAGQFAFGYDVLNRRTSLTRPNGVGTAYSYDSMSHLLTVLHQLGASTISGVTYNYSDAGNRAGRTLANSLFTYGYDYDELNQLVSVLRQPIFPDEKSPMEYTERYTYDAVGNRLSSKNLSPYQYNSLNQLTSTPNATYTYDDNGNTTSKSETAGTTSYAWDFENRLRSVALPNNAGTVSFGYDPFGRRISKSTASATTIYLYDGANVVEELNAAGTLTARYVQGEGIDEPLALNSSGLYFYEADGLGSVTSLTDSTGVAIATYTYDSFGNLTDSSGTVSNPYRYTAREYDPETGLYYYRARYYDPQTGRFLSEDPIGTAGYSNLYRYGSDNPISRNDPFGLRDILIVIWNRDLTHGSVGHVMALELSGDVILSQFPDCGCKKGKNETLDWSHSRMKEGRNPDRVFLVHVPNDNAFNATAQNHRNRPTWDWLPTNANQTNCVYAVDMSLDAGGVPVSDNDWPGNLGDELDRLRQKHTPKDPWNVQNGHLPNMNGK